MAEPQSNASKPASLGLFDRPPTELVTGIEVVAAVLSALWLAGSAVVLLILPEPAPDRTFDPLNVMLGAMAVVLPVAMIWVAALAARSSRLIRVETERLEAAVDALRQAQIAQNQSGKQDSATARKLGEIAAVVRRTEAAVSRTTAPSPDAPRTEVQPAPQDDQPTLALEPSAADLAPPLPSSDFIRALNFPDTADDTDGFAALRRALRDRTTRQLVQAAQDVLTLLSQEGIYMDDLEPDRARPEIWREFAQGSRGRAISRLGGIRDKASLEAVAGRMKQDPIFRDAAHHFLRKFDHTFASFEPNASDAEISALANTRTARAFMLLGRVAGTFD